MFPWIDNSRADQDSRPICSLSYVLMRCQTGDLKGKGRWVREKPNSQEKSPPDQVERAQLFFCSGKAFPSQSSTLDPSGLPPQRSCTSNYSLNNIIIEFCQIVRMAGRCMQRETFMFPQF
jgi:hypothetical protein